MKTHWIFTLIVSCLFFVGCSDEKRSYAPIIASDGSLPDSISTIFQHYDYPEGVIPVIHSVNSIDNPMETGVVADTLFDYYSEQFDKYDFEDYGILFFISKNPELIQVRVGDHFNIYSRLEGVSMGDKYLTDQRQYINERQDSAVVALLTKICNNAEERNNLTWYQSSQLTSITQAINSTMSWIGSPSENLYGKIILKPIYFILSLVSDLTNSWIIGIIGVFIIMLLFRALITYLLKRYITNLTALNISLKILSFLCSFFLPVTTMSCAFVFSSGRVEDFIALNAWGVPYIEYLTIPVEMFKPAQSIWLAGFFLLTMVLSAVVTNDYFLNSLLPNKIQRRHYDSLDPYQIGLIGTNIEDSDPTPYATIFSDKIGEIFGLYFGLAIPAMFFFSPAILWTGIMYSIVKITSKSRIYATIFKIRKQYRSYNSIPDIAISISHLILIPIFIGIMIWINWIIDPFDKKVDSSEEKIEVTTDVIKTICINTKTANLRTGPGKQYDCLTYYNNGYQQRIQAHYNDTLEVIDEANEWYKVRIPNTKIEAYIKKTLCRDTK